ncbi:MAG TPA: HupE/UreJ family protein [Casimicrobiaceae bacterium]|nr:HupE/UreJ family protein [Casimicrobiaceae bacterium]
MKRLLVLLAVMLLPAHALAHKASDAYLTIERNGATIAGRLDVALRDLDNAIGLDDNGDGDITWGEVRVRATAIAAYALPRVALSSGGARCPLTANDFRIDMHTDGAYAALALAGACPERAPTLTLDYRLFEGVDPQHRGLLNFVEDGRSHSAVFTADAPRRIVGGDDAGELAQFATYLHEGVFHIWTGFDHVLFLLSLLLPAVLVRRGGRWVAGDSLRTATLDVVKVVTAFTLAHSITLTLAALGVVDLPSRWVESAIALSVVLAALNNLYPIVANGRWIAAFGFGLLHGFGFAGALQDLGLPAGSLALSLAGFNLGVETGQLAIVLGFLPLAFLSRSTWAYRRLVFGGGSLVTAAIASVWLVERAFDASVFSALASR